MGYQYKGKDFLNTSRYIPADDRELKAKFDYFREAESKINGGPEPAKKPSGACGTNSGYMKHFQRKEPRCAPCKAAHTQVELKRQRRAKQAMGLAA